MQISLKLPVFGRFCAYKIVIFSVLYAFSPVFLSFYQNFQKKIRIKQALRTDLSVQIKQFTLKPGSPAFRQSHTSPGLTVTSKNRNVRCISSGNYRPLGKYYLPKTFLILSTASIVRSRLPKPVSLR